MKEAIELVSELDPELKLRVIPGHFSSDRFHMNYYSVAYTHLPGTPGPF